MGLLLRPIRTLILIGATFLAGVFYEKYEAQARCDALGRSIEGGICQ